MATRFFKWLDRNFINDDDDDDGREKYHVEIINNNHKNVSRPKVKTRRQSRSKQAVIVYVYENIIC